LSKLFIDLAQTHHAAWTSVRALRRSALPLIVFTPPFAYFCSLGVYGALFVTGMVATLFGVTEMITVRTHSHPSIRKTPALFFFLGQKS
jgi:hypothetical protein